MYLLKTIKESVNTVKFGMFLKTVIKAVNISLLSKS